jgi:hypothetical protein
MCNMKGATYFAGEPLNPWPLTFVSLAGLRAGGEQNIMQEDLIEKLLETWGAKDDPKYKESPIPVLVSLGYKIGHQWASRQKAGDLLSRFEGFYTDLIDDQLTKQRYNLLYEELDPASIIAEKPDMMNQALEDPKISESMLENYHLFENGIVWGLMAVIRKIIEEGSST